MLWAYVNFSQFLIIWSANLPEEIPWYLRRLRTGWRFVGLFLVLFHFAVPFLLLLSRPLKRDARWLARVAAALLAARLIDLFWLIGPEASPGGGVHWMDAVAPVGLIGLWLAYFLRQLRNRPLLPLGDPEIRALLEAA
jgi:fatty acid desaturase